MQLVPKLRRDEFYYAHVHEDGVTETHFAEPPTDRPFLTIKILSVYKGVIKERTWVKTFPDFRSYPVPKGSGWMLEDSHRNYRTFTRERDAGERQ